MESKKLLSVCGQKLRGWRIEPITVCRKSNFQPTELRFNRQLLKQRYLFALCLTSTEISNGRSQETDIMTLCVKNPAPQLELAFSGCPHQSCAGVRFDQSQLTLERLQPNKFRPSMHLFERKYFSALLLELSGSNSYS